MCGDYRTIPDASPSQGSLAVAGLFAAHDYSPPPQSQSQGSVAVAGLFAARDLAASAGITAPVLVVTDNEELRNLLQAGLMPGFVTPPYFARYGTHRGLHTRGGAHRGAAGRADARLHDPALLPWYGVLDETYTLTRGQVQGAVVDPWRRVRLCTTAARIADDGPCRQSVRHALTCSSCLCV